MGARASVAVFDAPIEFSQKGFDPRGFEQHTRSADVIRLVDHFMHSRKSFSAADFNSWSAFCNSSEDFMSLNMVCDMEMFSKVLKQNKPMNTSDKIQGAAFLTIAPR
jgi:hypothetical protein